MTCRDKTPEPSTRRLRGLVPVLLLAGLALSGCRPESDPTRVAGWSMIDPAQRHAIGVSREPEYMTLNVPRGSRGLSPSQRAEVHEFAQRARGADAGNTKLLVSAPAGSANEIEAANAVNQVRVLLSEGGIADTSVGLQAYHADARSAAPVRIGFTRYAVHAPRCGEWPTNLARERENIPYPNFGCATQRNFANQVANPADLVEPRSETDRSSERRDVNWGKYVKGDYSGSKREAENDEKLSPIGER